MVVKLGKTFDDKNYELQYPKVVLWILVVLGTLVSIFVVIIIAFDDYFDWVNLMLILFALSILMLTLYMAKWKIIVKDNVLIINTLLRKAVKVKIEAISTVKEDNEKIIGYMDGKKVFVVYNYIFGYNVLYAQFYEAGKVESVQRKDCFKVRLCNTSHIVGLVFPLLFVGGILIMFITSVDEVDIVTGSIYMIIFMVFVYLLCTLIHALRWELAVDGDVMTIRPVIGKNESYSLAAITDLKIKKEAGKVSEIIICSDEKKIARVKATYDGFPILLERLCVEWEKEN